MLVRFGSVVRSIARSASVIFARFERPFRFGQTLASWASEFCENLILGWRRRDSTRLNFGCLRVWNTKGMIVMACMVMACIGMACVVMACIVLAH